MCLPAIQEVFLAAAIHERRQLLPLGGSKSSGVTEDLRILLI